MADLIVNQDGAVLYLTLNRPESLNAFSPEMILEMTRIMHELPEREDIRAVVISGAGRSFSAGGDVKTMGQAGPVDVYQHIGKLNNLVLAMQSCPKPIIAAVHGFAAGAGFNLALACDMIVAADDAKFALSFSQVGLISDGGGSYFLPRLVGPQLAKEWFFLAEGVPAERLYHLGVVNRIVPLDELQAEVTKLAERLASGPSRAYAMIKRTVNQSLDSTLAEVLELERTTQTMMVTTEDHLEGVRAFREKRRPNFQGK